MSLEYYAFLANDSIPTRDAWQSAIDALSVPIVFGSAFIPARASGFSPMEIDGNAAGCEIDINMEQIDSLLEAHEVLHGRIPTNPSIFSFRFGGSSNEAACAFAAAAALVQAFGAIFYDPQEDMLFDRPDELLILARELMRQASGPLP